MADQGVALCWKTPCDDCLHKDICKHTMGLDILKENLGYSITRNANPCLTFDITLKCSHYV